VDGFDERALPALMQFDDLRAYVQGVAARPIVRRGASGSGPRWHDTVHPGDLRRPEVGPPMMKALAAGVAGRVAESRPQVFGDRRGGDLSTHERGKERRRRLLTYLRDHPEELRPVSRRLLRLSAA
jgi:hypothetical protein